MWLQTPAAARPHVAASSTGPHSPGTARPSAPPSDHEAIDAMASDDTKHFTTAQKKSWPKFRLALDPSAVTSERGKLESLRYRELQALARSSRVDPNLDRNRLIRTLRECYAALEMGAAQGGLKGASDTPAASAQRASSAAAAPSVAGGKGRCPFFSPLPSAGKSKRHHVGKENRVPVTAAGKDSAAHASGRAAQAAGGLALEEAPGREQRVKGRVYLVQPQGGGKSEPRMWSGAKFLCAHGRARSTWACQQQCPAEQAKAQEEQPSPVDEEPGSPVEEEEEEEPKARRPFASQLPTGTHLAESENVERRLALGSPFDRFASRVAEACGVLAQAPHTRSPQQ